MFKTICIFLVIILKLILVNYEILDIREFTYYLTDSKFSEKDTEIILNRIKMFQNIEYVKDYKEMLPNFKTISEQMSFNRQYEQYLRYCYAINPKIEINNAIEETTFLYKVLDAAQNISNPNYYICNRRSALIKLKNLLDKIDEDWYYIGMLPPHVPIWRFEVIR